MHDNERSPLAQFSSLITPPVKTGRLSRHSTRTVTDTSAGSVRTSLIRFSPPPWRGRGGMGARAPRTTVIEWIPSLTFYVLHVLSSCSPPIQRCPPMAPIRAFGRTAVEGTYRGTAIGAADKRRIRRSRMTDGPRSRHRYLIDHRRSLSGRYRTAAGTTASRRHCRDGFRKSSCRIRCACRRLPNRLLWSFRIVWAHLRGRAGRPLRSLCKPRQRKRCIGTGQRRRCLNLASHLQQSQGTSIVESTDSRAFDIDAAHRRAPYATATHRELLPARTRH